jgi:hypothetical protein
LTVVFDASVIPSLSGDARHDERALEALPELIAAPFLGDADVVGRWEWASPTSLAFVLERPLQSGRVIELRPTPALEQLAGRPVAPGTIARWETGPLQFLGVELSSSDPNHATLECVFDAPVEAARLADALRVAGPPRRHGASVRHRAHTDRRSPHSRAAHRRRATRRGHCARHACDTRPGPGRVPRSRGCFHGPEATGLSGRDSCRLAESTRSCVS